MFPADLKKIIKFWTRETTLEQVPNEFYVKIIISTESLALFLRYLTLIVVLVFYIIESFSQAYFLPIFLICILSHIFFTHLVFYFKQYSLFTNPVNFFLHLISITVAVIATEKEYSPLILFYPVLIFGHLIYAQKRPRPFLVSLISLIVLNFTIIGIWLWEGVQFATYYLLWKSFIILICGIFAHLLLNYINSIRGELYHREQELLFTQGLIKSILDSIESAILIFDEQEIIVDANAYAYKLLETNPKELIGQRIRSLLFDDTLLGEYFLSLKSRDNLQFSALALTSTGEEIPVDFIVQTFYQNQRKRYLGIMIDRREHKRLEEISSLLHKRKEEIDNKMSLIKDFQLGFSRYHIAKMYSYITTIKNILFLITQEQLGTITERQKNSLEIAIRALEQLEEKLNKEIEQIQINTE
ncbi:MAG TPA: PAS domain-containing protein [Candidatus Hydrogenedens sp.]|nr:PAS domain-containing protein [Candidatus Hydrogenedens sp.]